NTALSAARMRGDTATVALLLAAGAKVSDEAVKWAMQNGHVAVVQQLIAAGANIHNKELIDQGLMAAASRKEANTAMLELLVELGAKVSEAQLNAYVNRRPYPSIDRAIVKQRMQFRINQAITAVNARRPAPKGYVDQAKDWIKWLGGAGGV
ncbi:MAG TPA: hypothetical protein VJJ83_00490, partial [Candidatus Babeliales bacterium]|nr:hypothetical protein [Candidatus Babeliales bacterium]